MYTKSEEEKEVVVFINICLGCVLYLFGKYLPTVIEETWLLTSQFYSLLFFFTCHQTIKNLKKKKKVLESAWSLLTFNYMLYKHALPVNKRDNYDYFFLMCVCGKKGGRWRYCVCVCMCVCARVCARVCACVCVCINLSSCFQASTHKGIIFKKNHNNFDTGLIYIFSLLCLWQW